MTFKTLLLRVLFQVSQIRKPATTYGHTHVFYAENRKHENQKLRMDYRPAVRVRVSLGHNIYVFLKALVLHNNMDINFFSINRLESWLSYVLLLELAIRIRAILFAQYVTTPEIVMLLRCWVKPSWKLGLSLLFWWRRFRSSITT